MRRPHPRLFFLLFTAVLLVGLAASARNYALLVGVTQYPAHPEEMWLKGPTLDCELFADMLKGERFGFDEQDIQVLAGWPQEEAKRPTKANIAKAFADLAGRVRQGDQVCILLSGHGSQQPANPDPDDPEPDGLDEIFLPADAGEWDEKTQTVVNAIVDDEVKVWVEAILDQQASVWIVFDCCHSGTMARGLAVEARQARQISPESLIPAAVLARARSGAIQMRGGARAEPSGMLDGTKARGQLVAMYASQSIEPTFELPLPGPADPRRGIFTYMIANVLSNAEEPLTYRELADRVLVVYRSNGIFNPSPMIEGGGADHLVLGREADQLRPQILLFSVFDDLVVNAGQLHGMQPGSILEVFPPAGVAGADKSLGFLKVAGTDTLYCRVQPVAHDGRPAPSADALATGMRCRVVYEAFNLPPMRIAVQPTAAEEGENLACYPKGEGPVVVEMALANLEKEMPGLVERVESPEQADWLLRVQGFTGLLVPRTGWSGKVGTGEEAKPPRFEIGGVNSPGNFPVQLRSVLLRVARVRRLMSIAASGSVAKRNDLVDVEVEVLRYEGPDTEGKPVPVAGAGRVLRDGETVAFRVTNRSKCEADVTLLFVDSCFGISAIFPEPGTIDDNRLQPGQALTTPKLAVNTETVGPEQLIVIAVRSSVQRQDFTALAQESLGQMRGTPAMQSPLGELLATAMFGQGTTRGLARQAGREYRTLMVPWYTAP